MYDVPAELLAAIAAGEDSLLKLKEIVVEGAKLVLNQAHGPEESR